MPGDWLVCATEAFGSNPVCCAAGFVSQRQRHGVIPRFYPMRSATQGDADRLGGAKRRGRAAIGEGGERSIATANPPTGFGPGAARFVQR